LKSCSGRRGSRRKRRWRGRQNKRVTTLEREHRHLVIYWQIQ